MEYEYSIRQNNAVVPDAFFQGWFDDKLLDKYLDLGSFLEAVLRDLDVAVLPTSDEVRLEQGVLIKVSSDQTKDDVDRQLGEALRQYNEKDMHHCFLLPDKYRSQ